MTKHAEECGQHLQAQNTVCYTHSDNSYAYSASIELRKNMPLLCLRKWYVKNVLKFNS